MKKLIERFIEYKYVSVSLLTIYIFFVSLFYFNLTKDKSTSYVKQLFSRGYEYIVPEGHELEFGDSDAYNKLAYSLIERGNFYNPANQVSAWVTPGYPIFLAAVYKVFGYRFLPVFILQAFLLAVSYYMVVKLCHKHYGAITSFFALSLLVINLRFIVYTGNLYTEILFIFILTVICYCLIELIGSKNKQYLHSLILGLILGFGFLVRPVILPSMVIIPVILLFYRVKIGHILIIPTIALIIISTWFIRNYKEYGRILVSTNSEITLSPGYLNIETFNFFEPYTLTGFAKKNTPPGDVTFSETEKQIIRQEVGDKLGTNYPQGYVFEPVSYLFKDKYQNYKLKKPLHYLIRTTYLFKVLLSPRTPDMSILNSVISSILWIVTFVPFFIGFIVHRKIKYFWVFTALALSLMVAPAMNIVDSNLRYQLPSQFLITIIAAVIFTIIYKSYFTHSKIIEKPAE